MKTCSRSMNGGYVVVEVTDPAYLPKIILTPVAVLTGEKTASSGEAIVVAFRERPNTRSFGSPTAGFSTANAGYTLSDGALLNLTGMVFADRLWNKYGAKIFPDELVGESQKFTTIMEETVPQPAIDWLMAQPECAGS